MITTSRQGKNVSKVTLTPLDKDGELRMKMSYSIDADHVRRVFGRRKFNLSNLHPSKSPKICQNRYTHSKIEISVSIFDV